MLAAQAAWRTGFRFPVSGFWFQVFGFWFLVSSFWFPVSGKNFLVGQSAPGNNLYFLGSQQTCGP